MSSSVGSDVQSRCRKCGLTWHVVIAAVGGSIAQVECGDCGARHRHRPPGVSGAGGAPARPRVRKVGARRAAKVSVVEADLERPRRSFSAAETYQVGDRVVHASFGEGVVQAVKGPSKIEILFGDVSKVLVQGRGRS